MSAILLGKADYRRTGLAPAILQNRFMERAPTNLRDQVALLPRPGLTNFSDVSVAALNVYRQPGTLDDMTVAVTTNAIYSLDDSGAIVGTSPVVNLLGRCSITSGTGGICYLTDGAQLLKLTIAAGETAITTTPIAMPDLASCSWVGFLSGFFLFGKAGTHQFYFLRPGETTIDALDFFSAATAPDDLKAGVVVGDELWLLGDNTTEVWTFTGNTDVPFQRQIGRAFDVGTAARDTALKVNNGTGGVLVFVGHDRKVYKMEGSPIPVSEPGIEEYLRGVDLSTLSAWQFSIEGHIFYCLTVPGVATLALDLVTGLWTVFRSYERDDFRPRTSAQLADGRWLASDSESGALQVVDVEANTDAGEAIVRECVGQIAANGPIRCNNVVLECTMGVAPDLEADPTAQLSISDDKGATWDDWQTESLGRLGETRALAAWGPQDAINRPGRLFRFRDANDAYTVIESAGFNESLR